MYDLYLGDKDEHDILGWLIANIAPLHKTEKAEWSYYSTYRAKKDVWIMASADVSDVSGQYDTVTHIIFKHKDDAALCKLTWG